MDTEYVECEWSEEDQLACIYCSGDRCNICYGKIRLSIRSRKCTTSTARSMLSSVATFVLRGKDANGLQMCATNFWAIS